MRFRITTILPDTMAQMPSFEIEDYDGIGDMAEAELFNDYGVAMPIGTTVTVERVS